MMSRRACIVCTVFLILSVELFCNVNKSTSNDKIDILFGKGFYEVKDAMDSVNKLQKLSNNISELPRWFYKNTFSLKEATSGFNSHHGQILNLISEHENIRNRLDLLRTEMNIVYPSERYSKIKALIPKVADTLSNAGKYDDANAVNWDTVYSLGRELKSFGVKFNSNEWEFRASERSTIWVHSGDFELLCWLRFLGKPLNFQIVQLNLEYNDGKNINYYCSGVFENRGPCGTVMCGNNMCNVCNAGYIKRDLKIMPPLPLWKSIKETFSNNPKGRYVFNLSYEEHYRGVEPMMILYWASFNGKGDRDKLSNILKIDEKTDTFGKKVFSRVFFKENNITHYASAIITDSYTVVINPSNIFWDKWDQRIKNTMNNVFLRLE